MPACLTASSGRSKARAIAASTSPSRRPIRRSPPRTLTTCLAVSGSVRSSSVRRMAAFRAGPDAVFDRRERLGHLGERRAAILRRGVTGRREHVGHRDPEVGRTVVGLAQGRFGRRRRGPLRSRQSPTSRGQSRAGRLRRTADLSEDRRDRQLIGRQGSQVVGKDRRLLRGLRGRRESLGHLAPATHGGDGIPCRTWHRRAGFRRS